MQKRMEGLTTGAQLADGLQQTCQRGLRWSPAGHWAGRRLTHTDRFYDYADLLSTLSNLLAVQLQLADQILHVEFCRAQEC